MLVYGSDRPYNIAILVPNWEKLVSYGIQHAGGGISANSSKVGEMGRCVRKERE